MWDLLSRVQSSAQNTVSYPLDKRSIIEAANHIESRVICMDDQQPSYTELEMKLAKARVTAVFLPSANRIPFICWMRGT